ncbi:MAG: sigma-70 family RNA polymerase sigma factor [Bacteroidales bacterium]
MEINLHLTDKAKRDMELIDKARKQKDQSAYAELMANYRDALYFMMLKMTNNPTDAEDLTIEAFGKAFKNLGQYSPDYAFSTWLFRIASNNCIDFLRKKKKQSASSLNDSNDEDGTDYAQNISSNRLGPDDELIKSQKIEVMRVVVEKLKPHYRKLVELRYFQEYSYEEICQELDLPLGTVKAQLFRAREFLYHILDHSRDSI